MEYTVATAHSFIGKRVIVSLRYIDSNNEESFGGLWGVIDSAHEDGLLVKVEGGIDDQFWMLPPNLDALQPSSNEFYQMEGSNTEVTDVDYEAYFSVAGSLDALNSRS